MFYFPLEPTLVDRFQKKRVPAFLPFMSGRYLPASEPPGILFPRFRSFLHFRAYATLPAAPARAPRIFSPLSIRVALLLPSSTFSPSEFPIRFQGRMHDVLRLSCCSHLLHVFLISYTADKQPSLLAPFLPPTPIFFSHEGSDHPTKGENVNVELSCEHFSPPYPRVAF